MAGAALSVWGLVEVIRGKEDSDGTPPAQTTAEFVRECEKTHGMNGATQKKITKDEYGNPSSVVFVACTWPPSETSDPDGYSAITVLTEEMGGGSEASGNSIVDRVTGPCLSYTLTYTYNHMGLVENTEPVRLGAGSRLFYPSLTPWTEGLPFNPGRSEVVLVHGRRYELDQASCSKKVHEG
ncbi:hypothetical protein ACQKM2_09215 [Streptomyces sp. NPDC004126]|uniref:hypothetical protein n=1 Tax=Streptomyces sp. NPDC004126 TaxID=3390695 RepID=UPI003D038052